MSSGTRQQLKNLISCLLAIPTKDRAGELRSLLKAVHGYSDLPPSILIVDASTDGECLRQNREFVSRWSHSKTLLLRIETEPGLPTQRNIAIDYARDARVSVVHFLDDDVTPVKGYSSALDSRLSSDESPDLIDVGGVNVNAIERSRPRWFHRLFLLDPLPGYWNQALRNALPSGVLTASEVTWLSGFSMSFNLDRLEADRFDSRVELGPLGGYALGEDFEFTSRLSLRGKLMVLAAARYEHLRGQVGRADEAAVAEATAAFRQYMLLDGTSRGRSVDIWWSTLGEALLQVLGSCRHRTRDTIRRVLGLCRGIRYDWSNA